MRTVALLSGLAATLHLVCPAPAWATAPSGVAQDLSAHGLPLRIEVPACARVSKPEIRLADNEHDLLVRCEGAPLDVRIFGIQLGWARGKQSEKEIAAAEGFKRWIKKTPAYLEWEELRGDSTVKQFMTRQKIGGVAYVCFNLAELTAGPLMDAELVACRSIREAAPRK